MSHTTPPRPKGHKVRNGLLIGAAAFVALMILGTIVDAVGGGSDAEPDKAAATASAHKTHKTHKTKPSKTHHKADKPKSHKTHHKAKTHKAEPSKTHHKAKSSKPDRVKRAHKIEKKLDAFLPCDWKKQTNGAVHTEVCNKHQLILATSGKDDDLTGNAPRRWVDSVGEETSGWALVDDHMALISPDQGTINQAYDLLGATGKVESFG